MIRAPQHEGEVRSVPQPAQQEHDEGVACRAQSAAARPAEGNVDVVTKPRHERNVPPPPELGDATREVGQAEVLHQGNAKEPSATHGDVGVAREVTVNLNGKEEGCHPKVRAIGIRVGINGIDDGGTVVRNHGFLHHAPKQQAQAIDCRGVVKTARAVEVGQQPRGTLNGTCHQLRKECNEGEKCEGAATRLCLAAIHVDDVCQGLKRVETDAHGQRHLPQRTTGRKA